MSSLQFTIDAKFARAVAATQRLKQKPRQSRAVTAVCRAVDFLARGLFYAWRNRRYLTTIKLLNMAIVNIQFWLKTERVVGRPYNMKIESTNICNTKCQLCPTGLGIQGRPKGKMSLEQFKGLIDGMRHTLFGLDLSMWGDPLIVPDIYKMIRHAHDRGVWTYISSNLHAFKLGKGQAEQIVNSGLDMLTCSLHGATQETYELYQPGKKLDESIAKVKEIVETRNRMGSSTPAIQLNFVVTRHNEHEKKAFTQLAESLGCKPVFSTASLNIRFQDKDQKLQPLGLAPDLQKKKIKEHIDYWLPKDKDFALPQYEELLKTGDLKNGDYNGNKPMNCSWPWRSSVINWDGEVSTCCGSFEQSEDMGNVFEHSFGKVWNGKKYRSARRSFKKRISDADAEDNPCANCPGFML